ncbi:uncharacterized protein LOC142982220 [Anticarsia gemmatalis]|uniref:uncharacterized protein LOC142982220 n=1 Tax=Anticarsia gemmatalis TaxID=129554 RepID=UPI003F75CAFE
MATARLYCTFVLLLYLKNSYGQQVLANNQNIGVNAVGLQQQALQRAPNNINQIPNGGLNINLAQQPNLAAANLQQSPTLSGSMQGNLQAQMNLPPNMQSQNTMMPQNNFQITKIGFTPVPQGNANPSMTPNSAVQYQNGGVKANVQVIQPQNIPVTNPVVSQTSSPPISMSTLAELLALKGQPSLLSLINSQNNGQQNQQFTANSVPAQNQLTDLQKQYLVRSLQGQQSALNQQALNMVQAQPGVVNVMQGTPQQAQAIVTPLGNQQPYITVQAQPLTNYLQNQSPQVVAVEEEPSVMSMILSELGPQYAVNNAYPAPKKGSKMNLKSLIPLIINLLKEKNSCNCRNCGCPSNACQNNGCPNNMMAEPQMAQIFGGYSNQKIFGPGAEDVTVNRFKKNDDEESRNKDKERTPQKNNTEKVESEEISEEDDSEYIDDE